MRKLSPVDVLISQFDQGLRTVFGQPLVTERINPAKPIEEIELTAQEKLLSSRLMRVNHAGEVAAQALYQGQALTAKSDSVRHNMRRASLEENDHLAWCETRIQELGGHVSWLNPLWYQGSFMIGAMAGFAGDKWSLGFVAETEHQVVKHIDQHLKLLPAQDAKSQIILEQMKEDEARHATVALENGGVPLPKPICWLMTMASKVMTKTAFWL